MRPRAPSALVLLLVLFAQGMSGCTSVYDAHVPDRFLTNGWHENIDRRDEQRSYFGIGYTQATRVYQFDENRINGPYPAELVVISIRILGGASRAELFDRLDQAVQAVLEDEGVRLEPDSRREGERTLAQGQDSLWFTYQASAESAGFFDSGRRIRILGEVFNDPRSDITVLVIGLAQITGGSIITGAQNTSQWARVVADPQGTIEGHARSDGLAYNVVSHGA